MSPRGPARLRGRPVRRRLVRSVGRGPARSILLRELDVDASVLRPAGLVLADRVELSARGRAEPVLAHAEVHHVAAYALGAAAAEVHVVLFLAARIGAADEQDRAAAERPFGEA